MNRLLVSAVALLCGALPAHAQSLVGGKVQTGTPNYINDQNAPLSLDVTGALRVTGSTGGGGGGATGSVTAPGTNGTQAQAVQGINGGVPVGISAGSLPLPSGAATEATQQGVATSNSAINTATGAQSDAATASGANTSIIGALRAIRDRLLGTISTTPAGVTRTRSTCTLPAYASGGNIVCTDQAGAQTTTACAANTACLVSAANAGRKTALATVRTASVTCDVGYSATVAPGNAIGIDGPATAGGQGGSMNDPQAHVGTYYAACPAAATLVFVQGQ